MPLILLRYLFVGKQNPPGNSGLKNEPDISLIDPETSSEPALSRSECDDSET